MVAHATMIGCLNASTPLSELQTKAKCAIKTHFAAAHCAKVLFRKDGYIDGRCEAARRKHVNEQLKEFVIALFRDDYSSKLLFKKDGTVDRRCEAYRRGHVGTRVFRSDGKIDRRTKIWVLLQNALQGFLPGASADDDDVGATPSTSSGTTSSIHTPTVRETKEAISLVMPVVVDDAVDAHDAGDDDRHMGISDALKAEALRGAIMAALAGTGIGADGTLTDRAIATELVASDYDIANGVVGSCLTPQNIAAHSTAGRVQMMSYAVKHVLKQAPSSGTLWKYDEASSGWMLTA